VHGTETESLIGTQQSVYGDWSVGKLEESTLAESVLVPHQQRFYSDGQTRFSIAVHGVPTVALEKCVVGGVPAFSHSTAVATPFRGVVGIHNHQFDTPVETPILKVLSEQREGHPKNFPVEPSPSRAEPLEAFNRNVGVEFDGKISNVSNDFPNPVPYKVSFSGFEPFEASIGSVAPSVCEALKPLSPSHYPLAFYPDVFPVVELLEDFPIWSENRNGEAFAVHVDTEDIASAGGNLFFAEKGDNLTVRSQAVSLTRPTSFNRVGVSLKVPVLTHRNGDTPLRIQAEFDEEPALGAEGLAVPRHVELDGNCFDCFTFAANNTAFNVANYLAVEGGSGLAG
jgi:hypothetical protein